MSSAHGGGEPWWPSRCCGVLFAALAASAMGACAQSDGLPPLSLTQDAAVNAVHAEQRHPREELDKAIAYWGREYAKNPRDKHAAISYVRNLKAGGQKQAALGVLQQASLYHANDREFASEYGRLALEFGQVGVAEKLLSIADDPLKPDWRVISAKGTVLAKRGDYKGAIPYYERALQLAPGQSSVLNNLAMALAADGQPDRAEDLLRRALEDNGADPKVRQNLVVVLGLQGRYEEAKLAGLAERDAESNVDFLRRMVRVDQKSTGAATADANPRLRPTSHDPATDAAAADGWGTRIAGANRVPR